jgi:bromodomain-containing protein 7
VTTNAKTFNPVGTIYHSEADRIETWGLDQITKASSTVIEYETDWNIEIEGDDDGGDHVQDENYPPQTPVDVDDASTKGRSPSVQGEREKSRRATRGPYAKKSQLSNTVTTTEVISADGRLPGSKDGVGAFPPGSDWAEMMVQLKIKGVLYINFVVTRNSMDIPGKRYKTKKERLRIEKGGPPYAADGSLDYSEST